MWAINLSRYSVPIGTTLISLNAFISPADAFTFAFDNVQFSDRGTLTGSFDFDVSTGNTSNVNIVTQGGNVTVFGRRNRYTSLIAGDLGNGSFLLNSFAVNEFNQNIGLGITLLGSLLNVTTVGERISIQISPANSLEVVSDSTILSPRAIVSGSVVAVPEPASVVGTFLGVAGMGFLKLKTKNSGSK